MKKYFASDFDIAVYGKHEPSASDILFSCNADAVMYRDWERGGVIIETNGKPANYPLAGIYWHEIKGAV